MKAPQQRAIEVATCVAITLILAKLVAYVMTGSIALLSSLVDSAMDAVVSLLNMLAMRHALAPPDKEHRFGHGKAESLAALAQACFIAGSAAFLVIQAGQRLYRPEPIEQEWVGIGVMLFSMLLSGLLVMYQRRVHRQTGSLLVAADSLHYLGDLLANAGVILAMLLSVHLQWFWADALFGVAIAFIVLRSAYGVARSALDELMDRELPDAMRRQIMDCALAVQGVLGVHALRTRSAGSASFVQMHIELHQDLPFVEAHALTETVEAKIQALLPGADVLIHQDPVSGVQA